MRPPNRLISVLKAKAQVAVCTANQPASAMNTTSAMEKFAPDMPKARVEHMVALSPRSLPMMPPSTIRRQQIAKPITVAQKMEPMVRELANRPPTISIGMQIMVPIQMNATLIQVRFSLLRIWEMPLSCWVVFASLAVFVSRIGYLRMIAFLPAKVKDLFRQHTLAFYCVTQQR